MTNCRMVRINGLAKGRALTAQSDLIRWLRIRTNARVTGYTRSLCHDSAPPRAPQRCMRSSGKHCGPSRGCTAACRGVVASGAEQLPIGWLFQIRDATARLGCFLVLVHHGSKLFHIFLNELVIVCNSDLLFACCALENGRKRVRGKSSGLLGMC